MLARTFRELMLLVPLALAACSDQDIAPSVQPETVISAKQSDDPASASASSTPARAVDADYAKLLNAIVGEGLVHYEVLAQPERTAFLHNIVKHYASAALPQDPKERLALQINAYNANVLAMALHHSRQPGFTTVKEVSGFFDSLPVVVCGSAKTLNR